MKKKLIAVLMTTTMTAGMLLGCGAQGAATEEEVEQSENAEIPEMQNDTAVSYDDMTEEILDTVEKVKISPRTTPEVNKANGFGLVDGNGKEIFPEGDGGSYFTVNGAISYTENVNSYLEQEETFTGATTAEEEAGVAVIGD